MSLKFTSVLMQSNVFSCKIRFFNVTLNLEKLLVKGFHIKWHSLGFDIFFFKYIFL